MKELETPLRKKYSGRPGPAVQPVHARDELGISHISSARPVQAALASAGTFAIGAAMPLLTVLVSPTTTLIPFVAGTSLVFLAILGGLSAACRRRTRDESCMAGHVLGSTGHGTDRRRGRLFGALV